MEFVIFSDPHFYKNPQKSYIRSDGMNSWLAEQITIVENIFKYAIGNKVEVVICGGDVFHLKNRIDVETYNIVWELFRKYSKALEIIILQGNHDVYSLKVSSLKPFSDIATVITEPTEYTKVKLKLIPSGMVTQNELKSKCDILCTHEEITGLKYSNSFSSIGLNPKIFEDWTFVFNAHIHAPQVLGNIINIGSPMIQDWGESEETERKRFIHYKDGEIKSIDTGCPKFTNLTGINERVRNKVEADNKNFYRIDINSSQVSDSIFKKYNVFPRVTKIKRKEIRMKKVNKKIDVIKEYVNMMEHELDKDKLIGRGRELW